MWLTLVCHAPTAAAWAGRFPMDEPVEPAALARLANRPPRLPRHDRCLVSPALRAVQTAAALRLKPSVEPDLRDADAGRWRGRSLEEVARDEPAGLSAWRDDPESAPHAGESLADVLARVGRWLDGQRSLAGRTLAVTHPAVVRAAVVHALGAPPSAFWRIDVAPLATATLGAGAGRWTLRALGAAPDGD